VNLKVKKYLRLRIYVDYTTEEKEILTNNDGHAKQQPIRDRRGNEMILRSRKKERKKKRKKS
jgi:hypothetical protein